jgi:23S rRNA-/tRNA-specific pseudouridylate synthase
MAAATEKGRSAYTEYRVVEQFRGFSLLELKIKTGRTHQIRVHLSAIGHPVVGDDVYGERQYNQFVKKHGELNRYFLHAAALGFNHPSTHVPLKFHCPLPEELQNLLQSIKS